MRKLLLLLLFVITMSSAYGQTDDTYAKSESLDLEYIPKSIRDNIELGRGYDMTDPWYPVVADVSPFMGSLSKDKTKSTLPRMYNPEKFIATKVETDKSRYNEYTVRFEKQVSIRTLAQFFHADLKVSGGPLWGIEASAEYVKNTYDANTAIKFVLENTSTNPSSTDILTTWTAPPITEKANKLTEAEKWRLFKGRYGTHYITSFTYGYRIEIIAMATDSREDTKKTISAGFHAWMVSGHYNESTSTAAINQTTNIFVKIVCDSIVDNNTHSRLPFIITGIDETLAFLKKINDGIITIYGTPISMSLKSYYPSLGEKYPNSFKLFNETIFPADTNSVPKGTIMAWRPTTGTITNVGGEVIIKAPFGGWAVCDKRTHALMANVPDLSESFLMGVDKMEELKPNAQGSNTKTVSITTGGSNDAGTPFQVGDSGSSFKAPGTVHTHTGSTDVDIRPLYYTVIYLIKL